MDEQLILSDNDKQKRKWTIVALAIVMISVFSLFTVFRQKYIGACDWYAYYHQALLLKSGKVYLETNWDERDYPAVAPIGFYVRDGKSVPHFPPGYPLIMALFMFFGLEFFVTPLIGTLSFLVMFLIMRKFTGRGIAFLIALLWVLSPIVMWGSTHIMSDMVASFFVLLSFYFLLDKKIALAGLVFGFSLMVRPSNFVFAFVLLPMLVKQRKLIRFGMFCAITGSLIAGYNWLVHGAPWKYGFYGFADMMSFSAIGSNLGFYLSEALTQYTPLILVPALWGLCRKWKSTYIYGLWIFLFLAFYSLVTLGTRNWWGTRFLLPAYPALFILAGIGLKDFAGWVKTKKEKLVPLLKPAGVVFTVLLSGYFIYYLISETLVFRTWKGKEYYDYAMKVKALVPPDSIIGSVENSGSILIYTGMETFNLNHLNSFRVIKKVIRTRPVYIIYEPVLADNRFIKEKLPLFTFETVARLSDWKDYYLVRIIRRRLRPDLRQGNDFNYLDTLKDSKFLITK